MQPGDVVRSIGRGRNRAVDLPQDVRIGVAREARVRAEVPDGAHARAGDGVGLEEVLAEDHGRVELVEETDDRLDGLRDELRPDVVEVVLDRGVLRGGGEAGCVDDLCDSADAPE